MKKVKKFILVSAIIKLKCVLHVLDAESKFEMNLAWRLLMSLKKKSLINLYEDDLNSYLRSFGSDLNNLPLTFYQNAFVLPVVWNKKNQLEVNFI